jgi:hypothetical protein
MKHSVLGATIVVFGMLISAGQAIAACSLSGSSFEFTNFPAEREYLTAQERDQLAYIGAQAKAENCSITVTAVAPQNADKEAFNIRFKQSYVAREALVWRVGSGRDRVQAMEEIARYDVKAQAGRYVTGTVYINLE